MDSCYLQPLEDSTETLPTEDLSDWCYSLGLVELEYKQSLLQTDCSQFSAFLHSRDVYVLLDGH